MAERFYLFSTLLGGLLLTAQSVMLVALFWGLGRVYVRQGAAGKALVTDDGPEIHNRMPDFRAFLLDRSYVDLRRIAGRETVLLFPTMGCPPCDEALRAAVSVYRRLRDCPEIIAVVEAEREEAAGLVGRFGVRFLVAADPSGSVRAGLGVERTPYAVLVDGEGVVRMKGVVNSLDQLEGLIGRRGQAIGGLGWNPLSGPPASG